MSSDYYGLVRSEIAGLLPARCDIAMEIGCATGNTLHWLKTSGYCTQTIGVEYNPTVAAAARANVDIVFSGDIEQLDLEVAPGSVDLLLCLDVLEHLRDPWGTLTSLAAYVRPGGAVIASIPNIRYKGVVIPLLFKSKWEYQDFGHLDRSHLRFFVRETAITLVANAGFTVDQVLETGLGRSKGSVLLNRFVPEVIKGLLVKQYLVRGIKTGTPA